MYRKPSGRLGFSFTRAIQNAVPSITTTQAPGEGDANLTTVQKDDLVRFQLSLPDPRLLVEESFYVVHVTESVDRSRYVHKKLQQMSILSSHPADTTVYTSRITKDFRNQLALIPGQRQRLLVGMLFFWEEELARLSQLDVEERELQQRLESVDVGTAVAENLQIELAKVERQKRLLPSQRGENSTVAVAHDLPGYDQSAGTVGIPRLNDQRYRLPQYGDT